MAASNEDWSEWDVTLADGLEVLPWEPTRPRRVAEPTRAGPARVGRARSEALRGAFGALSEADVRTLRRRITEMYGE
jgi:hypothetical protein